jgi:hypothetical protein
MTGQISQQVLNRIVIGNQLLSTAGSLTPNADPLAVAQAVLVAHDASELILAALAAHLKASFKDKKKTYLMDYVDAIELKTQISIKPFFQTLNEARISFKHNGILPTPHQFYHCVSEALKELDKASVACIGEPLDEVGLGMLIEDDVAQQLYHKAKKLNGEGKFKEALESLALCFKAALDATPYGVTVNVGEPESEAALHLLGCGVDPSMFLSVQRFLPIVDWFDAISWNPRGTGHPGNWTMENVDYCADSLLRIILQIQHSQFRPHAMPFEYVYEDVLTANRDGVVVQADETGGMSALFGQFGHSQRTVFGELKRGQTISGHLTPALESDLPSNWQKTSLDRANLFVISQPKTDLPRKLKPHTQLFVRSDLVTLSHRVRDTPSNRERFPHLFEKDSPEGV